MKHHTLTTVLIDRDDYKLMRQGRMLSVTTPGGEEVLVGWDGATSNGASAPPPAHPTLRVLKGLTRTASGRRVATPEFRAGVVAYAKDHPDMSLAAVGRHFDVLPVSVREWSAAAAGRKRK